MPTASIQLYKYTECRVLRHAWKPTGEPEIGHPRLVGVTGLPVRCTRCRATKSLWHDQNGNRFGSGSIQYPADYHVLRAERVTPQQLLLALINQIEHQQRRRSA